MMLSIVVSHLFLMLKHFHIVTPSITSVVTPPHVLTLNVNHHLRLSVFLRPLPEQVSTFSFVASPSYLALSPSPLLWQHSHHMSIKSSPHKRSQRSSTLILPPVRHPHHPQHAFLIGLVHHLPILPPCQPLSLLPQHLSFSKRACKHNLFFNAYHSRPSPLRLPTLLPKRRQIVVKANLLHLFPLQSAVNRMSHHQLKRNRPVVRVGKQL